MSQRRRFIFPHRGFLGGAAVLVLSLVTGCSSPSADAGPTVGKTGGRIEKTTNGVNVAALVAPPFSAPATNGWPHYVLNAEKRWQINLPGERFDASGLLLRPGGELLTLHDRGSSLYRLHFNEGTNTAEAIKLPDIFTETQLAPFKAEKKARYDCEGLGADEQGRLYVCEEGNRWILRFDPKTKQVERLKIDWSPVAQYFDLNDANASFEGVAVGGGKLYVANERQAPRIIVVDLATLKVVDDFLVTPRYSTALDLHYSDLCWFEGALYVLAREHRAVLKVDPARHAVLAEYSYGTVEREPEVAYKPLFILFGPGMMEGLAVDRDNLWLVTDNNGLPRLKYPNDTRPTLFKCARPDKAVDR